MTYGCDLGIVTALAGVEHSAVLELPCSWAQLRLAHDETRYVSGAFVAADGTERSVIAATAPRMGMPAAAILTSKFIQQFRPRVMVMVGICAGRSGRVQIGDVVVADPTWDCGSGKIEPSKEGPKFLPDPHHLDLDPDHSELIRELSRDAAFLAEVRRKFDGKRPDTALSLHLGPLTSGAAVIADPATFSGLIPQHRKLLGLEMEAYAVMASGLGNGRPRPIVFVAKGVSDFADEEKSDDYQEYAAYVSASVGFEIAKRLLAGRAAIGFD